MIYALINCRFCERESVLRHLLNTENVGHPTESNLTGCLKINKFSFNDFNIKKSES